MGNPRNESSGNQLVLSYLVTSFVFFLVAAFIGVFGRLAIADPTLMSPTLFYQIITAHPLVMATGWGTMLLMGVTIYLIPALTQRPLFSYRFARATYWLMTIGTVLILFGGSTARYTALPPLQHTLITVLGLVLCLLGVILYCINVVKSTIGRGGGEKHPSLYYFTAGAVLGLIYLAIAGVTQAIPTIFGALGMPVTLHPLIAKHAIWFGLHSYVNQMINVVVLGTLYVAIPLLVGREIYSKKGAVWGLGFYLIVNVVAYLHHMFMDPIPLWQKVVGQYFTWMLAMTTALSVYNLVKTAVGGKPWGIAMKFIIAGLIGFMFEGSLGIFHSTLSVQPLVHNTQAIIGYVHAVFFLYITMCGLGALYALVPLLKGVPLYSERLGGVHLWTTIICAYGLTIALLIAGYLGMPRNIIAEEPDFKVWMELAAAFAIVLFGSQLVFAYNLAMTLIATPQTKAEMEPTGA